MFFPYIILSRTQRAYDVILSRTRRAYDVILSRTRRAYDVILIRAQRAYDVILSRTRRAYGVILSEAAQAAKSKDLMPFETTRKDVSTAFASAHSAQQDSVGHETFTANRTAWNTKRSPLNRTENEVTLAQNDI